MPFSTPILFRRGPTRPNPLGFVSAVVAALSYLFNDDFTSDESSPITSPRTAEPGPGTLTAVQTDGEFSITLDKLVIPTQATPAWGDQGFHVDSVTRALGRLVVMQINLDAGTSRSIFGFGTAADVNFTDAEGNGYLHLASGTGFALNSAGSGPIILSYAAATDYQIGVVLRATGCHIMIKGGAFSDWTLLWVEDTGSTATLFPKFGNLDAVGTCDYFRVPDTLWNPTPAFSDSFNRVDSSTLGNTDGAGVEESGGDGKAWVEDVGDTSINTNKLAGDGTALTHATVDAGEANIVVVANITVDTSSITGVLVRRDSASQYFVIGADDATNFEILEYNGSWFSRASIGKAMATNDVQVHCDGATITAYADGGNRITYGSATGGQTATKHGVHLDDSTTARADWIGVFKRANSDFPDVS